MLPQATRVSWQTRRCHSTDCPLFAPSARYSLPLYSVPTVNILHLLSNNNRHSPEPYAAGNLIEHWCRHQGSIGSCRTWSLDSLSKLINSFLLPFLPIFILTHYGADFDNLHAKLKCIAQEREAATCNVWSVTIISLPLPRLRAPQGMELQPRFKWQHSTLLRRSREGNGKWTQQWRIVTFPMNSRDITKAI